MARLVPKGAPDSRPLEVDDEAVEVWTERGYVPVKEKAAKKAPAKKSASSKSSK